MGSTTPFGFPLLEQLRDVLITNPINGQVLTYNSTLGVWENGAGGSAGVSSVTGGGGVTATPTTGSVVLGVTLGGDISGSSLSAVTVAGLNGIPLDFTSSAKGDIYYYNGTDIVNLPIGTSGQVLTVASGVPAWSAASGGGVSSVNGQTGAVLLTTPNSTLSLGTSGSATVTADLNLAHANTWSALQTFGTDISFLGAALTGTPTSGQVLGYNGTNWTPTTITTGVSSVSNSDGTLTISPTTGAVVASLALGHANTWTAAQTFTNSDLILLGSSTGATTFTSANSSATSYTATFPAHSGTVAELNLAQTWSALQTFGTAISFLGASLQGTPTSGQVLGYNGIYWTPTSIPAFYANASDTLLTGTSSTTIVSYIPGAQGNFWLFVYFRVITAATTVTLTATWDDGTGAQTYTWLSAVSEPVGSYTMLPLFVNATTLGLVSVVATAGTANQVYVSASIL